MHVRHAPAPATSPTTPPLERRMLERIKTARRMGTKASAGKILSRLYPDKTAPAAEVGIPGRYITNRLCADGSIEAVSPACTKAAAVAPAAGRHYKLTLWGRCRVMCGILGVPFLGLCILTDAYVTHVHQVRAGYPTMYVMAKIAELFDDLYDRRSILNMAGKLCSLRHVVRLRPNVIRLADGTVSTLARNEGTIDELYQWITGISAQLDEISVADPGTLRRMRHGR